VGDTAGIKIRIKRVARSPQTDVALERQDAVPQDAKAPLAGIAKGALLLYDVVQAV
jgi:hypothetical protein